MNQPLALILMGAPGAGKSTQAQLLQAHYNLVILSTGAIVRQEIGAGTALGQRAAPDFTRGRLLPDDVMIAIVRGALQALPPTRPFLLDGFPRTTGQASALDAVLAALQRSLSAVIALELAPDEAVTRLAGRRLCEGVDDPFPLHVDDAAQVAACLAAGGHLVQRADDRPEVVRERLHIYARDTAPLVAYYRRQAVLHIVDAGRDPDRVHAAIRQILEPAP